MTHPISTPRHGSLSALLRMAALSVVGLSYVAHAAVSISANPASVASGASSTLTWSSTEATSCAATGAWSGVKAISGSQSVLAGNAPATYTLHCSGPSGSTSNAVTVNIGSSGACTGSAVQACSVANGSGYQIRQCSNNTWGPFGPCNITCDPGYQLSGQTCVVDSTQNYNQVYYMDDTGSSDSNNGSETAPWATFDHAWTVLQPGNLLIVKDGTYQQAMVPRMSGAVGNPITIRAQNRGLAIITPADGAPPAANACYNGEQNIAIHVYTCQGNNPRLVHDLIIDGFIARGKGEYSAISVGSSDLANLENEMTHNIVIRNTGAFGSITGTNNVVFSIGNNLRDSLFEDVFSYGAGRKAMSAFGSIRITIRRAMLRYDFWTGNQYKPNDPRLSFSGYNTVDSVFENMIAMDDAPARGAESASRGGFAASGNVTDVNGITASSNNKYHGIISLNNIGNGFELDGGSSTYPMSNISLENVISWGNTGSGVNIQRNSAGAKILYSTIGRNGSLGVRLDPYPPAPITNTNIGNTYSYDNGHRGYSYSSNQMALFQNNSAVGNAEPNNLGGTTQGDLEAAYAPTLTYLVNPSKVAGRERGATILNRYVNGVQTTTPLWPWPNEDLIRLHMCNVTDLSTVDRNRTGMTPGWCVSNKALTKYIWEYLGSTIPPYVYGP